MPSLFHGPTTLVLAALLGAGHCTAQAQAPGSELGINVYGFSYHFERDRAKELGLDNEFNPGLGLRWRAPSRDARMDWFADVGAVYDSGRNTAVFAGGGVQWKLTQALRLGGALAFFYSETYNDGDPFIAPVPVLTYDWRMISVNMMYTPKVSSINSVNTLGFWFTFWPKRRD